MNIRSPRFFCVLFAIFVLYFTQKAGSAEPPFDPSADPDKLAVIELIEDYLANSFRIRQTDHTPDFGTLDMIYPQWHKGEPAEARRRWTFHGYRSYTVKYVVHTINLDQPGIMIAQGKKKVKLARLITFWIFPPELKWETSELDFIIKCRRKTTGEWIIVTESMGSYLNY